MRILKSHPLLRLVNSYLIDASESTRLNPEWNTKEEYYTDRYYIYSEV